MNNKVITVIVPCFNVENYISRCLDSIISQTIFNQIQVVCINDGSTDRTPSLLDDYQKKYENISVIHQENAGQSRARNVGLCHVTTPYVGFIDSDDWVNDQYYELLYNAVVESDADFAVCRVISIFDNGVVDELNARKYMIDEFDFLEIVNDRERKNVISLFLRDRLSVSPCNKLIKFDLIRDIKYTEGLYNEDMEFAFDLWMSTTRVVKTNNSVYYYWQRVNSTTKVTSIRVLDMSIIVDRILEKVAKLSDNQLWRDAIDFYLYFSIYLTLIRIRDSSSKTRYAVISSLHNRLKTGRIHVLSIFFSKSLTLKQKIGIAMLKISKGLFVMMWR